MADLETGVKDPEVTPTSDDTGVEASPPGDLEFEDDQIQEVEGERLVPLDVAKAERLKRQELERRLQELETPPEPEFPEEEPVPEFDWDKLMGNQPPQSQDQEAYNQFAENFREMVDGDPWQAMATAFNAFQQQQHKMEAQARQFAPDYNELPMHQVTDEEVMAVSQNPHALRALIAKAKGEGVTPPASTNTPAVPAQPMDEKQRWIEEGRKQERDLLAKMAKPGTAGESTSGPGTLPTGDVLELDEASKTYFKQRGYTDEQISKMASKVLEERRRKGLAL
ncbi:MAG: hypothetical protein ACXABY_30100 [Candidatus Thorarchaeota archaeon]|jgi:hypothetical protein